MAAVKISLLRDRTESRYLIQARDDNGLDWGGSDGVWDTHIYSLDCPRSILKLK